MSRKIMKGFNITATIAWGALILLASCDADRGWEQPEIPEDGVLIDTDVPHTKVYLGDKLLGETPLRLGRKDLKRLGLPVPNEPEVRLDSDGWGEGMYLGRIDEKEHKIHFLAPDPEPYLVAQTPWGPRTRGSGGQLSYPNYYKMTLDRRDSEKIRTSITILERNPEGTTLRYDAVNATEATISGHRPELLFQWGNMDTPWRKRTRHTAALPGSWNSFEPGEKKTISIHVPTGDPADGVSLFCVMNLFKGEEGSTLEECSYGDSVWLD